jgi:hypothetical protein
MNSSGYQLRERSSPFQDSARDTGAVCNNPRLTDRSANFLLTE